MLCQALYALSYKLYKRDRNYLYRKQTKNLLIYDSVYAILSLDNKKKEPTVTRCYQHPATHAGEATTYMTGIPASTNLV